MMNVIAIDDEPIALSIVENFCKRIPFLEFKGSYTNPIEALQHLQEQSIHLIFLDIKMPDINGIEWARSLSKAPMIIFTTAYSEHAVESFEVEPIDYLLKPFSFERFLKGVNKAYQLHQLRNGHQSEDLFIKTGTEQVKVKTEEILYLQSAGNYMQFVFKTQKILSRLTMHEAESLLPVNSFIRVHRSYIVSIKAISKTDRNSVWIDKESIPIGAGYFEGLQKVINR